MDEVANVHDSNDHEVFLMPWFKVDDAFHTHPKVLALRTGPCEDIAVALWVRAGSWSAANLTDGLVPSYVLDTFIRKHAVKAADELVRVRLWDKLGEDYTFRSWEEYQPSKNEIEAKRSASAERVRRHRGKSSLKTDALEAGGFQCHYCKTTLTERSATLDHIIPVSKGGETTLENIVACCISCNSSKSDKKYDCNALQDRFSVTTETPLPIPTRPDPTNKNSKRAGESLSPPDTLSLLYAEFGKAYQATMKQPVPGNRGSNWDIIARWFDRAAEMRGIPAHKLVLAAVRGFFADDYARERKFAPALFSRCYEQHAADAPSVVGPTGPTGSDPVSIADRAFRDAEAAHDRALKAGASAETLRTLDEAMEAARRALRDAKRAA